MMRQLKYYQFIIKNCLWTHINYNNPKNSRHEIRYYNGKNHRNIKYPIITDEV
jgi:hypothetical protein